MSLKDLLDLSEKLEERISAYWNFYTIVVIAVGGWLLTEPNLNRNQNWMLGVVMLTFFASNYTVIRYATNRLTAFESEIETLAAQTDWNSKRLQTQLLRYSIPKRMPYSTVLHLIIDLAVMVVIYWG